jgi:hypothetical protein
MAEQGQILWAWLLPIGDLTLLWWALARRLGNAGEAVLGFAKSWARLVVEKSGSARHWTSRNSRKLSMDDHRMASSNQQAIRSNRSIEYLCHIDTWTRQKIKERP